KMSMDLSRALVPLMGQHDALDGFVACVQLQTTATMLASGLDGPSLKEEAAGFTSILESGIRATGDPLGIGGLLIDASHLERHADLRRRVLVAAGGGLGRYGQQDDLLLPASSRLAFRELGLAIGLHAIENQPRPVLQGLESHLSLGSRIESFWLDPTHQESRTWSEHCDINEVMLATSLIG